LPELRAFCTFRLLFPSIAVCNSQTYLNRVFGFDDYQRVNFKAKSVLNLDELSKIIIIEDLQTFIIIPWWEIRVD
jgi:hypothetical protein